MRGDLEDIIVVGFVGWNEDDRRLQKVREDASSVTAKGVATVILVEWSRRATYVPRRHVGAVSYCRKLLGSICLVIGCIHCCQGSLNEVDRKDGGCCCVVFWSVLCWREMLCDVWCVVLYPGRQESGVLFVSDLIQC